MSLSVHPDADSRTLADQPAAARSAQRSPTKPGTAIRSRLFTKYVALFVAVVAIALLSNGIFEVFFYYREHKASLIRIQHEQAEAAAAKIGQFVKEIESQLGWTTQLPWSAGSVEQRRFDALRLLRQVPAITELAQVDSTGKERLRVSRLAMDVIDSGLDLSKDPKFTEAVAHKVYYGPVYFRRESEPYMTLSLAGTRKDAGVSIAEVNLKLIWDVVSQIKVGDHGHAYVVGPGGRLIAHPDISLVLRNTDMSKLVQVQAAQGGKPDADSELLQGAKNIQGQEVLTASAPIAPLGWTMFVELPVEEAYASLYSALQRLAVVLAAASLFAVLAGIFLARRMVGPIQALRAGAERIGGGDFAQRISVPTGDELEGLANQFNDMGARLQESYADLENKVEQRTSELKESLEQQTATSDILAAINGSGGDLAPVFECILEKAHQLCGAPCGSLQLYRDGRVVPVAIRGMTPAFAEFLRRGYPITEGIRGGLFADHPVQRTDMVEFLKDQPDEPSLRASVELGGIRTIVWVPLLRDGVAFGRIIAARQEVRAFDDKQITTLQGFAAQAAIAIENARLFNETREALERQTATADILKVIASSPSDVQPVFDAIAGSAKALIGGFSATVSRIVDDALYLAAFTPTNAQADEALQATFPIPLAEFPPFESVRGGETVQFVDTEAEGVPVMNREVARLRGYRSMLFTPLMNHGKAIGMISVTRKEPGTFADHHVGLLQTFADQAVIAIENARLFNETKEALERQTATADILKVIASSPSDVRPVFDAIASSAKRLVGGFSSTVFRFIDGMAYLEAFTPTTPAADEVLKSTFPRPFADFAPFRMAQAGEVMQILDTEALADEIGDIARARGFRSMLFAPLMNKGASIGFIAVTRLETGAFTDHHVQLLRTFADQAVIAIENARLFNETKEALEQLTGSANILRVIASSPTDVGPVLQAIVESACELCQAYDAVVMLKDGDELNLGAHHGPIPLSQRRWPNDRASISGRAMTDRHPVQVNDVLSTEGAEFAIAREMSRTDGCRTLLGAPLLREGESIGAIVLRRAEPHPFSAKQIALLQTFADQAVIAISNAHLFEEVQARTRELLLSLDELRTAQDRLIQTEKLASLGQLTAGIAHEIKNPLNFVNNFSALSTELIDELNDLLKSTAVDGNAREEVDEITQMLKGNLEKVVQHGKRADSIVKNMLLHSREGSGELRPSDINAIVEESLNLAYHGARAEKSGFNITLRRDLDPAAGMIELYPQDITRVFLNLISNGFYAATKRSETGEEGFEPTLTAATKDLGSKVEIRIRDNGTGIPAEVREKIFNPFFTTKPAGEGTGLGLSMSHDIIVKQHGGMIDVDTEPGEFTEFVITLPRMAAAGTRAGGRN